MTVNNHWVKLICVLFLTGSDTPLNMVALGESCGAASFARWVTSVLGSRKNHFLGCILGTCGYCLAHNGKMCPAGLGRSSPVPRGQQAESPRWWSWGPGQCQHPLRGTQHLSRAQLPLTLTRSYRWVCQLHLCSAQLSLTQLEPTLTGLKSSSSLLLFSRKTFYDVSVTGRSRQVSLLAAHSCRPSRNTKHLPGARARSLCLCSPILVGSPAARASTVFRLALRFVL